MSESRFLTRKRQILSFHFTIEALDPVFFDQLFSLYKTFFLRKMPNVKKRSWLSVRENNPSSVESKKIICSLFIKRSLGNHCSIVCSLWGENIQRRLIKTFLCDRERKKLLFNWNLRIMLTISIPVLQILFQIKKTFS